MQKASTRFYGSVGLLFLTTLTFLFASYKLPADDGYFYLQVADHVVKGEGFYFNTLYKTNGFHPLWGWICSFLAFINPGKKEDLFYLVWVFQLILFGASLVQLKKFWNNSSLILFPITFLFIIFCNLGTLFLTEAFINLFWLSYFLRKEESSQLSPFRLGIILGLIFLARLDNVFIILFLGIYIVFVQKKFNLKRVFELGVGFCLFTVPYLAYNYIEFGSIFPVSGKIKSFFPAFKMYGFNQYAIVLLGATILYLIVLITVLKGRKFRKLLIYFSLGVLLQLLYNGIFQSQIGQWYFVAPFILFSFLLFDFLQVVFKNVHFHSFFYRIGLGIAFLICTTIGLLKGATDFSLINLDEIQNIKWQEKSSLEEFVDNLKAKLPAGARIYTYDMPGRLAFYTDFDVIPADGLINNQLFSDDLNQGQFEEYLKKNKIDYVILPGDSHNDYPLTSFLGINMEKINAKYKYEIKDPYQRKVVAQMDMDKYKEILSQSNPLFVWQPHYDLIKVYQLKN